MIQQCKLQSLVVIYPKHILLATLSLARVAVFLPLYWRLSNIIRSCAYMVEICAYTAESASKMNSAYLTRRAYTVKDADTVKCAYVTRMLIR